MKRSTALAAFLSAILASNAMALPTPPPHGGDGKTAPAPPPGGGATSCDDQFKVLMALEEQLASAGCIDEQGQNSPQAPAACEALFKQEIDLGTVFDQQCPNYIPAGGNGGDGSGLPPDGNNGGEDGGSWETPGNDGDNGDLPPGDGSNGNGSDSGW